MMAAKANAIMLMSEVFKIQEKICNQQDDILDRQMNLAMCPMRERLQNESDKLEDIIEETLTKLDEFIKTME